MNNVPTIEQMALAELLTVTIGGAIGAIIEDCTGDGYITLPHYEEGKMYVGFIGGALIGALAGVIVDGSFGTALIAGYMGTSIISRLLDNKVKE
jgi:hypothetical protein